MVMPTVDARALARAQEAVAISDPEHLIRFLQGSDRTYLVFHAPTLVRGLPWPTGVDALMQVVHAYNSQRNVEKTGYVVDEQVAGGSAVGAPIFKDDRLWLDEIDNAIAQLQRLKAQHQADLKKRSARRG
jgi:hypothetical protein